jgi:pimeloyl-ACP methyl ester carboxylesterase
MENSMKKLTRRVFYLLTLLAVGVPDAAGQGAMTAEQLAEERRQAQAAAAASTSFSVVEGFATDADIGASLGLPPAVLTGVSQSGTGAAFGTFAQLGKIRPIVGTRFLAISSGTAGTTSPEPGTDFSPSGTAGDAARLVLTIKVPAGSSRLTFSYRFLSAEYPEYVGSQFNDSFSARVSAAADSIEIARSTVNSALFYPVSQANAGGSGFDIVSGGQPDAGLTNWIPVSTAVVPGSTVTLTFDIADVGDGIYDSMVLISALALSDVEVLDPLPTLVVDGEMSTNINALATRGRPVRGLVADGVARVLLRAVPPVEATSVRFAIAGGSSMDGSLASIGGDMRVTELTVPVVSTAAGPRAYAVYVAPSNYATATSIGTSERSVTLRATILAGGNTVGQSDVPIALVRPAVLFVHGLWGEGGKDGTTWKGQELLSDVRFKDRVLVVDYKATNAHSFATNSVLYKAWIDTALEMLRQDRLAAVQVDVVAHSMGGVLARSYASTSTSADGRSGYRRSANYNEGDFNRIITVNSPHSGSPFANVLVALGSSWVGPVAKPALAGLLGPIDLGAVADLREEGCPIDTIPLTAVPGHAMTGTGGSDLLDAVEVVGTLADLASHLPQPPLTAAILKAAAFFADVAGLAELVVFGNRRHDAIVPLDSEEGGLPASARSPFSGISSLHWEATTAPAYSDRLLALLNSNPDAGPYAPFPASGGKKVAACAPLDAAWFAADLAAAPEGLTLSIIGPSTVTGGTSVQVTATPKAGFNVGRVLITGPAVAMTDGTAPFSVAVTLPTEHVGVFALTASGIAADGSVVVSNQLILSVTPPATLQQIELNPTSVVIAQLKSNFTVTAVGTYSDGIPRRLSGNGAVAFSSSNTNVVTVDSTGRLTTIGAGYATLTASNGGVMSSMSVTVNPNLDRSSAPRGERWPRPVGDTRDGRDPNRNSDSGAGGAHANV